MAERQRPLEESDKDAANAAPAAETPMDRFKGLTRQLLGVPRDKLKAEQERYDKTKPHSHSGIRRKPP